MPHTPSVGVAAQRHVSRSGCLKMSVFIAHPFFVQLGRLSTNRWR
ncbi:hypothetical protein [Alysiella crassa]